MITRPSLKWWQQGPTLGVVGIFLALGIALAVESGVLGACGLGAMSVGIFAGILGNVIRRVGTVCQLALHGSVAASAFAGTLDTKVNAGGASC